MNIFGSPPPNLKYTSWSEFKKFIDGTYATSAFFWSDKGNLYTIFTETIGGISLAINLPKDNGLDHLDFENNFKDLSPRTPNSFQSSINIAALTTSSFSPDPSSIITGKADLITDVRNNLQIRGQTFSDEGSLRDDFSGSSLTTTLTGSLTFVNGSTTVTGIGTLFTSELDIHKYIKLSSHDESAFSLINKIISDTELILDTSYFGSNGSGSAVKSNWKTNTPSGSSISVSNSEISISSGTNNGNLVAIYHDGDYLPYNLHFKCRVSQRINNNIISIGFKDGYNSSDKQAVIIFDGTDNTKIKFRTSSGINSSDIQETVVTLPFGLNTSQNIIYQIDLGGNISTLSVNSTIVATHSEHIPGPYDVLQIIASMQNNNVVSSTTLYINYIYFSNIDQTQITNSFNGDPLKVIIVPNAISSVSGFSFGDIILSSVTTQAVRRTVYTEQTANFQGSIVSSSVNDTAAGTGARQVKIIYYDQSGNAPYTEIITLNGTTNVNLTNTDHCYIELIEVISVGSTGSNVGTITLRTGLGGAGTIVGTISPTNNQTFWNHHYVASGKTCYITSSSVGSTSSAVGNGSLFILKALPIGVANSVEKQISDFITLYGQSSTINRLYGVPIRVSGPARVLMYVTTLSSSTITYRSAFDFYDQ